MVGHKGVGTNTYIRGIIDLGWKELPSLYSHGRFGYLENYYNFCSSPND